MSEATLLESRVSKVEQDNRRLKLTVGALLLVLAAVPLVGAVMPEQIQDTVQARAFVVHDENGTMRAMMHPTGIRYYDENGNYRVGISDPGIFYLDENGNTRAQITTGGIFYLDENGNLVWCAPGC